MKKAIMFIALVASSVVGANAQKFQGGEKNIEVNFSPLSATPIGMNGIRFRLFNSESSAIRVGFDLGGDKITSVIQQPYEVVNGTTKVSKSELYKIDNSFNFSIRPGYEKHFAGTDRLSPYVGAEVVFAMSSSSTSEEYHSGNTASTAPAAEAARWSTWTIERSEGSIAFGLNAVAGADFYFADNFYLGAEISLGFSSTSFNDSEISVSDEAAYVQYMKARPAAANGGRDLNPLFDAMLEVDANDKMKTKSIIGGGNTAWGPTAQGTIRLGWLF